MGQRKSQLYGPQMLNIYDIDVKASKFSFASSNFKGKIWITEMKFSPDTIPNITE